MHEIVSVHIGQAGVQMSNAIWEQFCAEHNLEANGQLKEKFPDDGLGFSTFFCASASKQYVPRAIIVDLEPTVLDEIRKGQYRKLFNPSNLISGIDDASSNFARGHFTAGRSIIGNVTNQIRKVMETCDALGGFVLTSSFGGGTGSGFQTLVSEKLAIEYAKYIKVCLVVYPSSAMATSTVESYNAMLNNHFTIEKCDLSILFDNESLYKVCQNFLNVQRPTYTNLNRILSHITSCLTVSLRYESCLNSDLDQIVTNLVPYPRIHFPILNAAPILSESIASHKTMSIIEITKMLFENENAMLSVDTFDGDYFCCSLQYRGKVAPREVNEAIHAVKQKRYINFVDWCPTGFKVGINFHPPLCMVSSGISQTDIGVSMLANTSAIEQVFTKLGRNFDTLFQKRSFVHWFVGEGMEEGEFTETRDSMTYLIADYKGMSSSPDLDDNNRATFKDTFAAHDDIKKINADMLLAQNEQRYDMEHDPETVDPMINEGSPIHIVKENQELLFGVSEDNVMKSVDENNLEHIDDLTLLYD